MVQRSIKAAAPPKRTGGPAQSRPHNAASRHVPPRRQQAAQNQPLPQAPRSSGDLRGLLRQYGNVLTPQNKQLLQEVISRLEQGDTQGLKGIAAQLQKQLGR